MMRKFSSRYIQKHFPANFIHKTLAQSRTALEHFRLRTHSTLVDAVVWMLPVIPPKFITEELTMQ